MRIVGYVRVSTDRQAEHGLGLEIQERAIRAWCKTNGHRLVAMRRDKGVSGSNGIEDREELPLALDDIRSRRAEVMALLRLDRLARSLTVQEAALATVWRYGGRVFTTESGEVLPDDRDDPMRTAMRQMAGVFAELDKRMTVKRMTDGRLRKAEKGGFAAFGSPAFGQQSVDKQLVADPEEQAAIARIRELHAAGASLREIAATLTAEGLRPRRSDRWHPQSLARILARL